MRWPRLLRRRRTAPAPPLTFHHEQRTVITSDGPMVVRVPVIDDTED
jgi:hypothetical protein